MTAGCIIIVHDHCIHVQINDFWPVKLQSPYEKLLHNLSENKRLEDAKRFAEAFNSVGWRHFPRSLFNAPGVSFVVLQIVEVCQTTAGAVKEKAKYLLEKIGYRQSFFAFPKIAKVLWKQMINSNLLEISYKKRNTASACEGIFCDIDFIDAHCTILLSPDGLNILFIYLFIISYICIVWQVIYRSG